MKRTLLTVALCIQVSTGCVVLSEGEDSRLHVTWDLVEGDANAQASCPPDAITVAIVSEPLDDGDFSLGDGDEVYDLFDCGDHIGRTGALAPGGYDVWVNILDADSNLLAQSGYQEVTLGPGEELALSYELSLDRGSFGLTWTITDGARTLGCGDVNAGEVRVASTLVSDEGTTYDDAFACVDRQAVTPGLPLGAYGVAVTLLDGKRVPMHAPFEIDASLDFGNAFVDLGNFQFVLEE